MLQRLLLDLRVWNIRLPGEGCKLLHRIWGFGFRAFMLEDVVRSAQGFGHRLEGSVINSYNPYSDPSDPN